MSRDDRAGWSLGNLVSGVARRGRLLAIAEAAAWGVAAVALWPPAGVPVAAVVALWRWRAIRRAAIVRALEHAQPSARNLFVTADELERGLLTVNPAVRARVFADAAASARTVDPHKIFPAAPVVRAVLAGCLAWGVVAGSGQWRVPLGRRDSGVASSSTTSGGTAAGARLRVSLTIQPPAYTGLAATTAVDPEQIQAVEGAVATLSVESAASGVTLEHDGTVRALERGGGGRFAGRLQLARTGYLLLVADNESRRMIPVVVSPDALPTVRLTAPGRDLVYGGGNPRIAFETRATDDFGLRSLALRYTIVSGSGEQFDFKDGEIPLAVTRASPHEWNGAASRSLSALNLKEGDMLVYRAVAADGRPGDGSASSDAFFIEISKLGVAAGDAFTLPEEETRYALSQQMLIVKTGRLHSRRNTMAPAALTEAALSLAVEQRMIRAEFVFMLGGEVQNEEVEAEQSTELQAGRLENRGQRDVRAATIAMSRAEKLLTAVDTAGALVAERAAVAALQRAFSRERYILRALTTRGQLDPGRRLTGNLADAADWRRTPANAPVNQRTALLQDLLRGIAELSARGSADPNRHDDAPPGEPGGPFRQRALVLAEEAIRIDPAATLLREAATELQRAADATAPEARSRAVAAAATAAASEARRAHADAPLAFPSVAPALSGAFSDGLAAKASRAKGAQ